MKKMKKNLIYKNFDWAKSGGSEPPGLNVTPP